MAHEVSFSFSRINRFSEEKAIYPEFKDNRKNLYEEIDPNIKDKAASVACLIEARYLQQEGEHYRLSTQTLSQRFQLGEKVRFHDEPSLGFGTAFLVGPKLALTAGHCVCKPNSEELNPNVIQVARLVFGFQMTAPNQLQHVITKDNVQEIEKVVGYKKAGRNGDWALIALKNEVVHLTPLDVDFIDIVTQNIGIYILGHPSGLPMKFAEGTVCEVAWPGIGQQRFEGKIAAYQGNSGSPVFNKITHKVVGILVAGNKDFSSLNGVTVDHQVTPEEIAQKGYEKCQRTSAIPDHVIELISQNQPDKNLEQAIKARDLADRLYNQTVSTFAEKKDLNEVIINFIRVGMFGLLKGYEEAQMVMQDRKISIVADECHFDLMENFRDYLIKRGISPREYSLETESSGEGVVIGDQGTVRILTAEGGKAIAKGSTFAKGSIAFIGAKELGKASALKVTALDGSKLRVEAVGSNSRATADGARLGNNSQLKVEAGVSREAYEEERRKFDF